MGKSLRKFEPAFKLAAAKRMAQGESPVGIWARRRI